MRNTQRLKMKDVQHASVDGLEFSFEKAENKLLRAIKKSIQGQAEQVAEDAVSAISLSELLRNAIEFTMREILRGAEPGSGPFLGLMNDGAQIMVTVGFLDLLGPARKRGKVIHSDPHGGVELEEFLRDGLRWLKEQEEPQTVDRFAEILERVAAKVREEGE